MWLISWVPKLKRMGTVERVWKMMRGLAMRMSQRGRMVFRLGEMREKKEGRMQQHQQHHRRKKLPLVSTNGRYQKSTNPLQVAHKKHEGALNGRNRLRKRKPRQVGQASRCQRFHPLAKC